MDVDRFLRVFAAHQAEVILIGGMNFYLRHQGGMTFDIDFWIEDTAQNRARINSALLELEASWGKNEETWGPVPAAPEWLEEQTVFCLTTSAGALDLFREVKGLEGRFHECYERSEIHRTSEGTPYRSLNEEDMLACQLALPEAEQRLDRVRRLREILEA